MYPDFIDPQQRSFRRRAAIAAVLSLGLVIALVFGLVGILDYAQHRAEKTLKNLEQTLGLRIKIRDHSLSLFGAQLEDISIGQNSLAVISNILAELNLNPFAGRIGQVKRIHIENFKVKASLSELQGLSRDALHKRSAMDMPKNNRSSSLLPMDINVDNGVIVITDAQNNALLTIEGLRLRLEQQTGLLKIRVGGLKIGSHRLQIPFIGQLQLIEGQDIYPYVISGLQTEKSHWQIHGKIKRDLSNASINLKVEGLEGDLAAWASAYVVNPGQLHFTLQSVLKLEQAAEQLAFLVKTDSPNLTVQHHSIASGAVGPLPVRAKARGRIKLRTGELHIDDGLIAIATPKNTRDTNPANGIGLWFNAQRTIMANQGSFWEAAVRLPRTACQSILNAIPNGLMPQLSGFGVQGDVAGTLQLTVATNALDSFAVQIPDSIFTCKADHVDYEHSPERLKGSFSYENPYARATIDIGTSMATSAYTPSPQISGNLKLAIVASEDGGFWQHDGIDWGQIVNAVRLNIQEHRFAVGGSTITMQTAKNLFLGRERTLARKLQEAGLAWYLENSLSKARILEIYLNIIEFGPGIYGITEAAKHYFNKSPAALSLLESVYLASTLPSPVRRYKNFCEGQLSAEYRTLVNQRLKRLLKLNLISMQAYDAALGEPLRFVQQEANDKAACLDRIARATLSTGAERTPK